MYGKTSSETLRDEDEDDPWKKDSDVETASLASHRSKVSFGESVYASTIWSLESEHVKKVPKLNDQQWVMQRKKIGLSRKVKKTQQDKQEHERNKSKFISFMESAFKRKECVQYVHHDIPGTQKNPRFQPCFCGATQVEHKTRANYKREHMDRHFNNQVPTIEEEESDRESINSQTELIRTDSGYLKKDPILKVNIQNPSNKTIKSTSYNTEITDTDAEIWKEGLAIREFPTNAFGQIEFDGSLSLASKYVRISDNADMARVKELLTDHWDMLNPRPRLALSIIGGAKNFKLDGRKRETFKSGLIAAARATNAWVLTAGTNTGVMKLVGEAVKEGQYLISEGSKMQRGLKAIGLCTWGFIHGNKDMVNKSREDINKIQYNSNIETKRKQPIPLNPNHTHFILIDDGYRYTFFGSGGITKFIGKFEEMISCPQPAGLGIPLVAIIVEGGTDAIFEAKDHLANGQPCVVIDGSGRAANIIAYAYRHAIKTTNDGAYKLKQGNIKHIEEMLEESYADRLKGEEGSKRKKNFVNWVIECIRYADLISIFDIRTEENLDYNILTSLLKGTDLNTYSQLYLAMVWDRVDIAEEKIFSKRNFTFEKGSLDEVMRKALLMERTNFVELLIMNGFSINDFLTVQCLRDLYNSAVPDWPHLLEQIEKFVGPTSYIYLRTIHKYLLFVMKKHRSSLYELDVPPTKQSQEEVSKNSKKTFDQPFFELFIWANLCNKQHLMNFFWERSGYPLAACLLAGSIYSTLIEQYRLDYDVEKLSQYRNNWINKANAFMEIASAKDKNKALSIVERRYERFGDRSLLKVAFIGNQEGFIGNTTSQESVRASWQRGFVHIKPWLSIIAIFCPLLILTPAFTFLPLGDDGGNLSPFQKMFVFYKTPMVKFYGNCISYLFFVLLYTYIALFNYTWNFQYPEIVLYIWFLILIIDEFREVLIEPSRSFTNKMVDHMSNVWNRIDFVLFFFAILSLVLKLFPQTFGVSRIIFATNATVLYVRVLRIYHVKWNMGPKVVIMYRMFPEMLSFMMLLIIFILAYGTASQALINPATTLTLDILPEMFENILWLPYWQMYGELSLDKIVPKNIESCNAEGFCENFGIYSYVTPVFLAIYLLIGNVMLLNLLIAIFTSVFDKVNENSKEVWKWEMYRLASEYDRKPGLAPPLVIIEDIWKLFKSIWKLTCRGKREDLESLMVDALETLDLFEKDCLHEYLSRASTTKKDQIENRMIRLEENVHKILKLLEESPGSSNDDWGDVIDTDTKLYDDIYIEYDQYAGRENKDKKERGSNITTIEKDNRKAVSARLMSARMRNESAKVRERLLGMEDKIGSLEERTSHSMEKMENMLTGLQNSFNKSDADRRSKRKHRSRSKSKKT